jgi:hypothetical protein
LQACLAGWLSRTDANGSEYLMRGNLFALDQRPVSVLSCPRPRRDVIGWFNEDQTNGKEEITILFIENGRVSLKKWNVAGADLKNGTIVTLPDVQDSCQSSPMGAGAIAGLFQNAQPFQIQISSWQQEFSIEQQKQWKLSGKRRYAVQAVAPVNESNKSKLLDPKKLKSVEPPPGEAEAIRQILSHIDHHFKRIEHRIAQTDTESMKSTIKQCEASVDELIKLLPSQEKNDPQSSAYQARYSLTRAHSIFITPISGFPTIRDVTSQGAQPAGKAGKN